MESEITTVNEFKKKSFESDKKILLLRINSKKLQKSHIRKKIIRTLLIRLLRKKNNLILLKKNQRLIKHLQQNLEFGRADPELKRLNLINLNQSTQRLNLYQKIYRCLKQLLFLT